MAVTAADIVARFPEFGSLDPSVIDRWLAEASRSHNVTQWGGKSDDALAYLTAHLLTCFAADPCEEPGPGPVTSEKEGQVAVAYAVSERFSDSEMGATKYGRRYIQLLRTIFVTRCF